MANKFTRFLNDFASGAVKGITNPKGLVSNWQHATRIFVDDTYRLAPRTKFMFYVRFEIDKTAHKAPAFTAKHGDEVGFLVKSADLPKFNFDSVTKNQYNRKKIVYKQINYEPVNISLHDDNAGIVNALWAIYYGYYIVDRNLPVSAYGATHLRANKTPLDSFRYGMDNDISTPFFKSISIYTLSRRRFLGYTLINPRIKSWNHGSVAYAEGDTLESQMTLEYEAVKYSAGTVSVNNPKGFATLHYDLVPSPLSVAGGGVSNLTGDGGVLDGLEQIFGDIGSGATFNSFGGFLGTAIKTVNTYKNFKGLTKEGLKNEAINILSNPANIATAVSTVGGVVGAVFPKSTSNTETTPATQKRVIPDATGGVIV
jgi:hypothetical protein